MPTYDIFLYVGFVAFFAVFLLECRRYGISRKGAAILGIIIPTAGLLFAWLATLVVSGGRGQTLYVAAMGSILAGGAYAYFSRLLLYRIGDAAAPAAALGFAIMKLGCLIGGCCAGVPTGAGLHAVYAMPAGEYVPKVLKLHPEWANVALAPVQLWVSLLCLGAFVLSYAVLPWAGSKAGRRLGVVLGTYAAGRFVIDFWWGGEAVLRLGPLIDRQLFGLLMIAVSLWLIFRR